MRTRRSKEDWQELILRQADSDLSAQQFCRDNDVRPKYFSIRKKLLGLQQSAFVPVSQSRRTGDATLSLSTEQFSWLLRGLDIAKLKPHQEKYFFAIG